MTSNRQVDDLTYRTFYVSRGYGTRGSTRLDVLDSATGEIWDYKSGVRPMSQQQIQRIIQNGPGVNSVTPVYKP